jgi:nitroreductase
VDVFAAIDSRSSAARLMQPGPTREDLDRILDAAGRAPDHGRLKPWRLVVLDESGKVKFAHAAAAAKRVRLPSLSDEQLAAERDKLLRSPTIVIVGCAVREHPKVPEIEQISAAAAAAQNLFLAAHALGYGVMWKTGAAAYDPGVKAAVGLQMRDHIVAIMHLGTRVPERNGPQ